MPSPARPPRVSTPRSCGSECPQGRWDDLECPPLCSGHFQRKEYFKFRDPETPAGVSGSHFHERSRKEKRQRDCFRRKQALQLSFTPAAPSYKNAKSGSPQAARLCSNSNNFSAIDAQSATTTTAASGGNREELLGQRPARRKCRPRHAADAGCRNPISGAHLNRPTCPAGTHSHSFSGY